ncbi:peptidyl-prolyl cis-trans isomerase [Fredinandcohnia quinoae]|uniref:Peptidyl-prolyl cis-trans isomerase n=1 Tax=Fredinandcohnia quinoae TaxID=2918902 RepID=A0AAW5DTF5_9BACI|nr:peptidyl-prolyl cis-trans isomerase [Fredinandcohnia sp. SECRCQ15]MCH1623926.1 peptidyl-prolyl cis-trans isomerase [Fredinandcohnia sp. SECRCQ15]
MSSIIMLEGNTKYKITLDPGVWIFDDRRIDLTTYFENGQIDKDELNEYTKAVSRQWDREIQEGAIFPPTLKSEKRFEKEKVLTGTFAIPFRDFLNNAEPNVNAESFVILLQESEITIPLETAYEAILGFSKDGKPLLEDGPVHFYFGDGTNKLEPIKNIIKFIVK